MHFVVFVAQMLSPNTSRFIEAAASLPEVRLALVSQDASEKLSEGARAKIIDYSRVENIYDTFHIAAAVLALSQKHGRIHRLFSSAEMMQLPLAEVREQLGIEGMRAEAARNFRDKARMKRLFSEAGVPCARYRLVTSEAEAWAFADEIGFPLVVKPPEGVGATATFRVETPAQLHSALLETSHVAHQGILIEEFMTGQEHSFDAVTIDGRIVWHSLTRYYPTPLEVMRNPHLQWCVVLPREVDDAQYDDIRRAAADALNVLGMDTGVSHLEWFRREDGSVAVSEVGARPPGAQFTTLISVAHDIDFLDAWARLIIHNSFDPPQRQYAAGIAFLRGQGEGERITSIQGLDEIEREMSSLIVRAKLPEIGAAHEKSYEGDGFIIVRHEETETVERALHRIVSHVRVTLG